MTNAEARFNKSHIRKVYACLAVTCHLHFWQNDRDFLRVTVVTRGWNGYRNKSQHRKSTLEKKILPPLLQGFEPATFQSRGDALTTELSPPPLFSRAYNYFMYGLVGELVDPTRFWHRVQSSFLRPLASCVDTVKTLPNDFALYSYSISVTKSFASLAISIPPGSLRTHGFELSVALRPQRPYGQLGTGSP